MPRRWWVERDCERPSSPLMNSESDWLALEADVAVLGLLMESSRSRWELRWRECCETFVSMRRDGRLRAKLVRSPVLLAAEAEIAPFSVSDESEVSPLWWELLCSPIVGTLPLRPPLVFTPLSASSVPPGPLLNPVPRPPPAAMAAALKTAAALRPSRTWCSRSTVASRSPSIW